jgi:hypothetical protein
MTVGLLEDPSPLEGRLQEFQDAASLFGCDLPAGQQQA